MRHGPLLSDVMAPTLRPLAACKLSLVSDTLRGMLGLKEWAYLARQ